MIGESGAMTTHWLTSILRRFREWHGVAEHALYNLIAITARFGTAAVFWRSGETKVDGWKVTDFAIQLFRDEYKVPLLPPELAANLAAIAEHVFPVLLVVGLASRFSALALLGMTAVIQIFVFPQSWPDHLTWTTSYLFIIVYGPGRFSLDHIVRMTFQRHGML